MTNEQITARFQAAIDIVRDSGSLALRYFGEVDSLTVDYKGPQDMASEADREVENFIRGRLAELFPEDGFFGEEGGIVDSVDGSALWVVDPIDGTACFVSSIPVWCVSIAFMMDDEIELGVIYDPNANELFAARRGHGATLDDVDIQPSEAESFAEGTVGIG